MEQVRRVRNTIYVALGQNNFNLNKERVRLMYGDDNVDTWLESRKKLLDVSTRKVFTNELYDKMRVG